MLVVQDVDVLIIGASLSGLTLANVLSDYGVSVRIIDADAADATQEVTLYARSLEIFDVLGITQTLLTEGHTVQQLTIPTVPKETHLNFADLQATRHPYLLMLPQERIEAHLIERLRKNSVSVENSKTVTHISQTETDVTVSIQDEQGTTKTMTATYLIAAKRAVSDLLGIEQIGDAAFRQVERYRYGQVLLLGDAAYRLPSMIDLSTTLGIADAFNLAWKLGMVVKRQSPHTLLDSYHEERYPLATQVMRTISASLTPDTSLKRRVRDFLTPLLDTLDPSQALSVENLSQLGHHYKNASTVRGQDGNLRAGERLPNYPYVDIMGQSDLYAQLDSSKHTLLLVGDPEKLRPLADVIQTQYTSTVAPRIIAHQPVSDMPCPIIADISRLIPLKPNFAYLIRPDHMISLINTVDHMRAAVHQEFGERV